VVVLRKCIAILIVLSIICLTSCNFDPYGGTRPIDYGETCWVCENPPANFTVDPLLEDYYYPEGEIKINNNLLKFKMYFIHGTNEVLVKIIDEYSSAQAPADIVGFDGYCTFSKDKLIIKIDKETDNLFNGKYNELIFVRDQS
jgi:hypothetical protein